LRLRLSPEPSALSTRKALGAFQPPSPSAALVRDLHIYGQMAQLVRGQTSYTQHKGLGKKLLAQAEKIAKQNGFSKIAVISGIGVRGYYRKLGYRLQNTYMVKNITPSLFYTFARQNKNKKNKEARPPCCKIAKGDRVSLLSMSF